MRAIWKGAIAFGLVNVPVKVYSATEDHDISLHQVHNADGGRIRYQRRCEVCSQVIDYSDIEKAFEEDGRTVVLSKEELKAIPAENSHEIEVVQFVPSEQLEPMMFEKSYYLEPDSKSPKAYVLLRRALEDTDRVAIVQFALREKTRLGAYLRAATENAPLVQAFGVNVPRMVTLTYGAGVALAALGGVLAAPIYSVNPQMGSNLIIVVFAVVVIGGMGSILGAVLTGFGLGIVEGLTKVFYPEASATVIFVIMVIVLLARPAGLFGRA